MADALTLSALRVERADGFTLEVGALAVAAGTVVGLTGPNGSGKSSLLAAIDGTLERVSGDVRLLGASLADLALSERARRVAHVGATPQAAFDYSVLEIVMMGRYPHRPFVATNAFGLESEADEAICRETLERVGLSALADRSIRQLSAGERQRVGIARALAQQAPLLLLDEPTSHLDPAHQIDLQRIVRAHAADGGTAVVALHDLSLAAALCDRIVLLDAGRVIADGTPAETLTVETLERVYRTSIGVDRLGDALWIRAID